MKLLTKFKLIAASAFISVGFATTSQAATCQFGSQADFDLQAADVYTSTDCIGEIAGNDDAATLNGLNAFGMNNWVAINKVDSPGGSAGKLTVTYDGGAPSQSGTWSVTSWAGVEKAVLVLKGANSFAAYLLDLTAGTSGGWMTTALETGNPNNPQQPDVSHIALYEVACTTDPCDPPVNFNVPLPAGMPLILSALGVFGVVRARKRKSA